MDKGYLKLDKKFIYRLLIIALNLIVLVPLVIKTIATTASHGGYSIILIIASFFNLAFAILLKKIKPTVIQAGLIFPTLKAFSYWGNALFLFIGWDIRHSEKFAFQGGSLIATALLGIIFVWRSSRERKESDLITFSQIKNPEELVKLGNQYKALGRYIGYLMLCLCVWLLGMMLKQQLAHPHFANEGILILLMFVVMPFMQLCASIRENSARLYWKSLETAGRLPDIKESWFSNHKNILFSYPIEKIIIISFSLVAGFFIFRTLFFH